MYCLMCGTILPPTGRFCSSCGACISASQNTDAPGTNDGARPSETDMESPGQQFASKVANRVEARMKRQQRGVVSRPDQTTRKVSIGWRHKEGRGSYGLLSLESGGGIHKIDVEKETTLPELEAIVISTFFEDGKSQKYNLSDLEYYIGANSGSRLQEQLKNGATFTLDGFFFETHKRHPIRIYLYTTRRQETRGASRHGRGIKKKAHKRSQRASKQDNQESSEEGSLTPPMSSVPSSEDGSSAESESKVAERDTGFEMPSISRPRQHRMPTQVESSVSTCVMLDAPDFVPLGTPEVQRRVTRETSPNPTVSGLCASVEQEMESASFDTASISCEQVDPLQNIRVMDEDILEKWDQTLDEIKLALNRDTWDVSVIRADLVRTVMDQLEAATLSDWNSVINVTFIGEDALDGGGPRREMLSLLFRETDLVKEGKFIQSALKIEHGDYALLGRAVAYSLVIGHPGPKMFHSTIVDYIITDTIPQRLETAECSDGQAGDSAPLIDAIRAATRREEFLEIMDVFSARLEAAGINRMLTLDNKQEIIGSLILQENLLQCLAALRQFMEGLQLHGILDLIRRFPQSAREALQIPQEMTKSDIVKKFYQFTLSPTGSNRRTKEEMIIYNFHKFLGLVQRGKVSAMKDEQIVELQMTDVLQAFIASPYIPGRMEKGQIFFEDKDRLTDVSTCTPSITFHQLDRMMNYKYFEERMIDIIINAPDFGCK